MYMSLVRLTGDFLLETMEIRRAYPWLTPERKKKKLSARNSISGKTILQSKGEIKTLPAKRKLKEFIVSRPTLQEKEVTEAEMKGHQTAT